MFLPQLPHPPRSGGRIVTAPLVEGLAKNHEVHLFSLLHGEQGEDEGKEFLSRKLAGVHVAPGAKRFDLPVLGQSLFSRYPYKVHRFTQPELAKLAAKAAKKTPPDAIHCQNFYTACYARDLEAFRKVLYQENFETRMLERWAETAGQKVLGRLVHLELKRTLHFEMECPFWFDRIATISRQDEDAWRASAARFPETLRRFEGRLRTIRPSVDLDYYRAARVEEVPSPFPDDGRKRIVFTGFFGYEANVDGAVWLATESLPKLNRDKYSLWLVGQKPSVAVQKLHAPPDVIVTGAVPDVRPFLLHADLSVIPLRIGGGIRLKILEALALGCPVVSTSVGCEGLWSSVDPPIWTIADTPEEFAAALESSSALSRNREEMFAWVAERFSPARFVEEMEALYCGKS